MTSVLVASAFNREMKRISLIKDTPRTSQIALKIVTHDLNL
jgi:hypothetical protein